MRYVKDFFIDGKCINIASMYCDGYGVSSLYVCVMRLSVTSRPVSVYCDGV